jgi:hypothetical protein
LGIAAAVGAVVAVVGGLLFSRTSTLSDASMCANGIVREDTSPDRRWKAVVFERDCGATTRESTQVSIVPAAAELPNESGNVFVAYVDPSLVRVSWTDPNSAIVSRPKLSKESVFLQEEKVKNVTITFVARE